MFTSEPHVIYEHNQLITVICQLRFPTILSIAAKEPAEFQELVREDFPVYKKKLENPAPKLQNQNGVVVPVKQDPVVNYSFTALDGNAVLNLTDSFIAFTVNRYSDWEKYAAELDRIVAGFCSIYKPACFERVGLRYMNAFSKEELNLTDYSWRDLLQPEIAGLLDDEDFSEGDFTRCTQDAEFKAPGGCRIKLHAGPGLVRRGNQQETKPRYILDLDTYMSGQILPQHLTGALQTTHLVAYRAFRGSITRVLHEAMNPSEQ